MQGTPKFEVIVGNVGTVYTGNNYMQANGVYGKYVEISRSGVGRAGNEPVTLFHKGEIKFEYAPKGKTNE